MVGKRLTALLALSMTLVFIAPANAFAPVRRLEPKKVVPLAMSHPKEFARQLLALKGFTTKEYGCLVELWRKESNWRPKALNKSSGAFGIAQFMPTTWANYGFPYMPKDPAIQIVAGLRYIKVRYSTPCQALAWHLAHNWY